MKTAVVTGSTQGIGLGLAEAFLERDCNVVICSRHQDSVDQTVARLVDRYPSERILGQVCDVTDFAQVQALRDAAQARFGRIDLWVNNAGLGNVMQPVWEQPPERLEAVVSTNIMGVMYCCKVAINGMIAQGGGHIYNMEGFGSNGQVRAGLTPYGTTKYAIRFLTKALVKETENTPVKISTISPGMVVTDLLIGNVEPGQEARARHIFNILADRVETVTPWLVARMLENDQSGARIQWLTRPKIISRFLQALFRKRQVLDDDAP